MAVGVVLFLPDRQPNLDLIDNVAAGQESFVTMRRRHANPDCAVTNLQKTYAVHTVGMQMWKLILRFGENGLAFG
jgi:hypothetical protein